MKRRNRSGMRARVGRAVVAAAVAGVLAGCAGAPPPKFDGPVNEHDQGTVWRFGDVSIGMAQVRQDSAVLHVWRNGDDEPFEILTLEVGEAGESNGLNVRLCGVWNDIAYYVTDTEGSVPECPAQISPDA